jgi:hypothetical protein
MAAELAVLVAIVLYLTLPQRFVTGPDGVVIPVKWLVGGAGFLLVLALVVAATRFGREHPATRMLALGVVAVVGLANTAALGLLIQGVLRGPELSGPELVHGALVLWCTNVVVFAVWFWELERRDPNRDRPDFLFPQLTARELGPPGWSAGFVDYLYVSFTNAAAFSPTDTMPLTPRAKLLMLAESAISILTIVFVLARAVNVL